jgi:hypothetical protein
VNSTRRYSWPELPAAKQKALGMFPQGFLFDSLKRFMVKR